MLNQTATASASSLHLGNQKLSELQALQNIHAAVSRQIRGVEAVLKTILTQACHLVATDHGSLILVNPKTQFLQIVAVAGADWTPEKRKCCLGLHEGITGRVAALGKPYICGDTQNDLYYYPLFENVQSEIAVPFLARGRVIGLLNCDSSRRNAFSAADAALLAAQFYHVPFLS